jgi:capsular exopolysaccharide synthesis family protein
MSNSPVPYDPYGSTPELGGQSYGGAPASYNGGAGQAPAGPPTSLVKRTISAIVRFKWMILAILILGSGAGFVAMRFQHPVYESRSRIWIGQNSGGSGAVGPIRQGQLLDNSGWQSLLVSGAVLDPVIKNLRLYLTLVHPEDSIAFSNFNYGRNLAPGTYKLGLDESGRGYVLSDGDGVVLQRAAFGDSAGAMRGFEWIPQRMTIPSDRPIEFTMQSPGDVMASLTTRLNVSQRMVAGKPDDNFLVIALRGADRDRTANTLEAVVDQFEQVALDLKTERLVKQREILDDQLKSAEQQLAIHESELRNFQVNTATLPMEDRNAPRAALGIAAAGAENSMFGSFFAMNSEKDQVEKDAADIRHALNESRSSAELVTAMEVIPSVKQSSQLTAALKDAAQAEAEIRANRAVAGLKDEHPMMVKAIAYRDSIVQRVIPMYANVLLGEMDRRHSQLDTQITSAASELKQIPERMLTQQKLERQKNIAADLYQELENRYQAAKLAESITVGDLTVLDRARPTYSPVDDPRQKMLLIFLGGSLALAIGAAILRDRLDPRIQYPDQVTGDMGLNILGAVPALRGGRLGPGDMALAVEAFRSIQLSLTHAVGNGGPMMVTFTSPGASDGKSFVTSNLAIAFADMGHRTLVIDGDVRRGTMHKLLGATHKPGLTDYLTGRIDRGTVIQETRYPLLHFIGCGSRQESGPKLLGSPTMRQLMRDLRADYDVILVDSPPLGACVDPMILSTLTKNMVLVVRTGSTDRSLAESKLDALDRLPVRVVGAVLNDVAQGGPYRYYSYVAGYEVMDEESVEALPGGNGHGPLADAAVEDDD